jgi:hypothetical protein
VSKLKVEVVVDARALIQAAQSPSLDTPVEEAYPVLDVGQLTEIEPVSEESNPLKAQEVAILTAAAERASAKAMRSARPEDHHAAASAHQSAAEMYPEGTLPRQVHESNTRVHLHNAMKPNPRYALQPVTLQTAMAARAAGRGHDGLVKA